MVPGGMVALWGGEGMGGALYRGLGEASPISPSLWPKMFKTKIGQPLDVGQVCISTHRERVSGSNLQNLPAGVLVKYTFINRKEC